MATIFEAVFVGASLFEAAVWLLGGVVLCAVGLAFFADALRFRRRAVVKRARILGVIGKKQGKGSQVTYWPVYEHSSDGGELIRTRASTSGSLARNLPGSFRDVLVDPEDPYDVRSLTPIGMVVGIGCLAAGAGLFAISNAVNDDMGLVSSMAIALVAAAGLKLFVRGRRSAPVARRQLQRKWRARRVAKRIPDLSQLLSREDHLAALRRLDAARRRWLPLVALLGLGMLSFGLWRGRDLALLASSGSRAEGTVVRIESTHDPSSEGSQYTYRSVVRFADANGREVTFRDSIGSSHPIDERGEVLPVIYDPSNRERAIIDRGLWNWAIPGGVGAFGASLFALSLRGLAGAHRRRRSGGSPRGG